MLKCLVWVKIYHTRFSGCLWPRRNGNLGLVAPRSLLQIPRDKCAPDLLIRWNHFNDFIAVTASTKRVFDSYKAIRTIIHSSQMNTDKNVAPSEYINFA